ncbi:hypothetical protein Gotur_003029 [Gossypium turneri]
MRKGDIATNLLGVCTPDMHFVYVLPGWEGFVADGWVLQDAIRLLAKYSKRIFHYETCFSVQCY